MRKRDVVLGFRFSAAFFGCFADFLDMLLLLNVLLHQREWCAPSSRTKIRVRPQGWQLPLQHRKLLTQETRGTALDQLLQAMNAEVGIDAHRPVGHDRASLRVLQSRLMLFTHLTHNLFQSLLNRRKEHLPAIFRTPDHMRVAGREHVPVALVSLAHTIEHTAFGYLLSRAFVLGVPGVPPLRSQQGTRPSSPWMNHKGFRARELINISTTWKWYHWILLQRCPVILSCRSRVPIDML
jgi:hypothetical protein